MKLRSLLTSSLLALAAVRLAALPVTLSSQYDVIVENNLNLNNAHIHGRSAVGGNVVLNGGMSEFGNNMNPAAGPALVVGGNVVLNTDGRVNGSGAAKVGALTAGQTIDSQGLNSPGNRKLYAQSVTAGSVGIDFTGAFNEYSLLSQSLAGLASTTNLFAVTTGDTQNKTLNLSFAGTADNVLNLTLAEFTSFKNIQVGTPGGNTGSWIINVDLTGYNGAAITQNRFGSDAGADEILWNFFGASTLTLQNAFYGTVLGADLALTHDGNDLKGQVIASSFTKLNGQVHIHTFDGDIPPSVPESGSVLVAFAGAVTLLAGLRARRAAK